MLRLTVVTPEGQAYDADVASVVLPGSEGRFGVLERHERFLAPLQTGAMEIRGGASGNASAWGAVSDGFADVSAEQVIVLVDRCRLASEADVAGVEARRAELQSELDHLSGSEEDTARRPPLESELRFLETVLEVTRS